MKVSIIVPAYNAAKTVCDTVESLLQQTYKDIEILLINDGSKDNTLEIISQYSAPVRVIDKENGGVGSARNRGIQEATGDCIAFVDADDVCRPDLVESLVKRMEEEKVDYVIAGYTKIREKGKEDALFGDAVYRGKDAIRENVETILSGGLNCPYSKLYKRSIIEENGLLFDTALPLGEDMNFNLEYLFCVSSLAYLNKSVYDYLMLNSTATTIYRGDLYERRILSLNKMNATFEKNGMKNPAEASLRIKILYAVIFNLQKKTCPLTFSEKKEQIKKVKKEYLETAGALSGITKVLDLVARVLPVTLLYAAAKVLQFFMGLLPDRLRGVSV